MKTIEKPALAALLKSAFLGLLVLAFSCSPDPVQEEELNLDSANAKSQKAVLKTLVKGAALNAANGLDVGPDGNLYVASVNGQEIVVMNKNNGKILQRFSGPANGVDGPDDLVIDPAGEKIYWTDILTGEVGQMNLDGSGMIKQGVAGGVNPIRFSAPNPDDPEGDPRLFIALDFLGDGIYELDPDFAEGPRQIIECPDGFGLGFFNSFDTRWEDGELWLYGPLFALNVVVAINIDSFEDNTLFPADLSGLFTSLGTGQIRLVAGSFEDSDLFNPAAAKFGPDGMLYVLDQAGKLFKVNPDPDVTDDKTLFTTLQPGLDNMTFDEDGTLYMTNNDEGWVAEILPSGQARYISPGGMIFPQGLAVLPGENNQDAVFEADLFNLRQFNGSSGREENKFKGFLIPEGSESLILPMNLSSDGEKLVVSSWFSGAVQIWDPRDGSVEAVPLAPPGVATVPIDALAFKGDVVVSDLGLGGVVLASNPSTPILPIDNATVFAPGGLATDGNSVWVADWGTGLIWQINFTGTTPDTPFPITTSRPIINPEGITFDNEGRLLVVETGTSSLLRISKGGEVTTLVEGLELGDPSPDIELPPTWSFDGVAVGPSGDIYISGAGANVIYKIPQNKVR